MQIVNVSDVQALIAGWERHVVRCLTAEETLAVRWRVFDRIARSLDNPLDFTGSVQSGKFQTFYWDHLATDRPSASKEQIREQFDRCDRVLLMFEVPRAFAYELRTEHLDPEMFEEIDLYLLPFSREADWMIVFTHELQFGPWILDKISKQESARHS